MEKRHVITVPFEKKYLWGLVRISGTMHGKATNKDYEDLKKGKQVEFRTKNGFITMSGTLNEEEQ